MFKSISAFKASFDTGTATSSPVNPLIAFAKLSIKVATSDVPAAFSGSAVALSATFEAASFALSNAVFLSWGTLGFVYLSEAFTFSASATNFCRESILESKPWAIDTILSTSALLPAASTCVFNSAFCAAFKCSSASIFAFAVSRYAFTSASFTISSNCSLVVAASICFLYSSLWASVKPGTWSIFFLYSSFKASVLAFSASCAFLDFWFCASSITFVIASCVVAFWICSLYWAAVGFSKYPACPPFLSISSMIALAFSFVFSNALSKILSTRPFVCSIGVAVPSVGSVITTADTWSTSSFFSAVVK